MSQDRFQTFCPEGPIPQAPSGWTWEDLMALAIKEAESAYAEGEVPVGAIIVDKKGNIISQAHNLSIQNCDPCAHAEILAIRKACASLSQSRLSGCTLLVTLEPCLMCAGAITLAALEGLVFGAWDARAGAIYSQNEFINLPLTSQKIWYMGGIFAKPCGELLTNFFASLRFGQ